jgi:hypothetical protein
LDGRQIMSLPRGPACLGPDLVMTECLTNYVVQSHWKTGSRLAIQGNSNIFCKVRDCLKQHATGPDPKPDESIPNTPHNISIRKDDF